MRGLPLQKKPRPLRQQIASSIHKIRTTRGWTQAQLAARIGVSQAQLSAKERGESSFSAEQLIEIMRLFNVGLDHFVDAPDPEDEIQNALARHGATHLREIEDITPTERLQRVGDTVARVLLGPASARLITALAPVLVKNISSINLFQVHQQLKEHGRDQRLGWLVENTRDAVAMSSAPLPSQRAKHRQVLMVLEHYLDTHAPAAANLEAGSLKATDLLDDDMASRKTLVAVWSKASPISRRWGVVSALQPADFARAMEDADASR